MADQWLKEAVNNFINFINEAPISIAEGIANQRFGENCFADSEFSFIGLEGEILPFEQQVVIKSTRIAKEPRVQLNIHLNDCAAEDYSFSAAA